MGNEVIRIETDGKRCRIPDEFLQTAGFKTCYERYSDGTYTAYNFNVQSSPKPPDYVYTAEERTTFDALVTKADAAITEIKRRADSGEFTPKKGVDYFTDEEKTELMEGVSSGAVGEFRKVVDTATTEYNDNHNLQLAKYNANASALQGEVDRLRGECDQLAAENRKQENRIDALLKLNKGQTYDILPEEGEAASRTAPSGAKYVSVDKVGGKSVVWNQLLDYTKVPKTTTDNGITYTNNMDGTFTAEGTAGKLSFLASPINVIAKHHYLSMSIESGSTAMSYITGDVMQQTVYDRGDGALSIAIATGTAYYVIQRYNAGDVAAGEIAKPQVYDLTQMFGAGNEPTAEQFERMFPAESYPYNPGEIISSRTETITAGAETITTGFPELRSALAAHDYIDMDGEKVHRKIKITRIDGNTPIYSVRTDQDNCCRVVFTPETSPGIVISEEPTILTNIISDKLATITHNNYWSADAYTGIEAYPGYASISMRLQDRTDLDTKEKVSAWLADNPTTVYYETESDELTDVTIPEALTEWLPVEPGGTVTFQNADESKQLPVPNAVSWVRKLNEVE
ncbi:hypothetical protein [Mogibacterium sp.]|uniref:hypothetical protein n=1 Tax=Mogibacterium sp. TaxID=2049035 RepID=UPI0025805AF5|nr:hypothetical protein [Mogibacterium sp.]MBN2936223.1 hypothetical protein [Mogibacterium sp.]